MCGITGIVTFDGREPQESELKAMTGVIEHRGPNDEGFYHRPGVGLGFRRLSIIDLAEGHQPLGNEDGTVWLVFNGEIYNYKALRAMLIDRGHRFTTHTDSEVIVHLYEEYGEECVTRLRGMFGFAIWDENRRRLFAARDHFGIKPLYYAKTADGLLFGSEIKSLLAHGSLPRALNAQSVYHYLTFQYVPEPDTMFAGIQKLPPAHTLTVEDGGQVRLSRYWDPSFQPEDRPFGEVVEELRERLKDSVEHHMVSDVQRGCFLSSGIDSTAIAAHMRAIEPIKTFSVGFEGPQNETEIAFETARALGTEHYARIIDKDSYFASVESAVWHQDEPVADPSAIALYHVAQLAAEHVTVVLSGEGADELFGGYRIYREPSALAPISWLPGPLKSGLHQLIRGLPGSFPGKNYLLRGTTPLERRFLGNAQIFRGEMKDRLLDRALSGAGGFASPWDVTGPIYDRSRGLDPVSRMQYIDLNLWMPGDILMKADKMTMAHSLELRVPFLDTHLFELARRIPAKYRIADGTTKHVFRKAMEGIVPDFILHRPKLGFPVPLRQWLREQEGERVMDRISSAGLGDIFRMDEVERLYRAHRDGTADYARHLWILYIFALWHDAYLSEQPRPAVMTAG